MRSSADSGDGGVSPAGATPWEMMAIGDWPKQTSIRPYLVGIQRVAQARRRPGLRDGSIVAKSRLFGLFSKVIKPIGFRHGRWT